MDDLKQLVIPYNSIDSAVFHYLAKTWKKFFGFMILSVAVVAATVAVINFFRGVEPIFNWQWPAFALFVYTASYSATVRQTLAHEFFKAFAEANHYSYAELGDIPNLSGRVFNLGHDKKFTDIITGQFQGLPMNLFNYSYKIDRGLDPKTHRQNEETHSFTILRIGFNSTLPEVVLNPTRNTAVGTQGLVRIDTPGEFDKKFNLWSAKEFELEALQIFGLDIMEDILAKFQKFSLEFTGNNTLIYYDGWWDIDKKSLQVIFEYAEFLIAKLKTKTQTMSGDVKAMQAEQAARK
jgi:hypothetical protein